MKNLSISIFETRKNPYYIVAPGYAEHSSGIRVLHFLAHVLNNIGYLAFLVSDRINDKYNVIRLTDEIKSLHKKQGLTPIWIYPEVTDGNPHRGDVVVRYLLNKPGKISGKIGFSENEIFYSYLKEYMGEYGRSDQILTVPSTDPALMKPLGLKRKGSAFYVSRNKEKIIADGVFNQHPDDAFEISYDKKISYKDLSVLLNRVKVLFVYELGSIIEDALLCQCPVILCNNKYINLEQCSIFFDQGCVVGFSKGNFRQAKKEVLKYRDNLYLDRFEEFKNQLDFFIDHTQKVAENFNQENKVNLHSEYDEFLRKTSLQEIDGQILAERMVNQWSTHPGFTILIDARAGEESLLADTIDSIIPQWYKDWNLVILANFPPLSEELANADGLRWIQYDGNTPDKHIVDSLISTTDNAWLLYIEAGHTLEAHALAYVADYINFYPEAKLLYCDEDIQCLNGQFKSPKLKPEFNLEMLRNSYYLGKCVALKCDALLDMGGWSREGEAAVYDIALNLTGFYSTETIYHIPYTLFHAPEQSMRELDAEAEKNAVVRHLEKNNILAEVNQGFLFGTQQIVYKYSDPESGQEKVSIVIVSHNQPGYLSCCVDSLLEETGYGNYELIIVDHNSTDQDALEYLGNLKLHKKLIGRFKLLRSNSSTFNYAALCNLGASHASGDFILFLDNDTQIIQKNWLDILIGYMQQQHVAAVGPRLSFPANPYPILDSGPRILGMDALAGGAARADTNVLDPGNFGNFQIAQDVSALSGSCFLVRKSLFNELLGFDAVNTPRFHATLDFCIRISKHDNRLRMIWTPYSSVAHHKGVTNNRENMKLHSRPDLLKSSIKEHEYLLENHVKELANDKFYHRKLSLIQPYAVEGSIAIEWDVNFHDRLRILGAPVSGGSGIYRLLSPFQALQRQGLAQTSVVHPLGPGEHRLPSVTELERAAPDTYFVQHAIYDPQLFSISQYRKFNKGTFIAYSVDDVLGNLPEKHHLYNFHVREGKYRLREGLSLSDRLIASTEPLRDYCKNMIDDIVVVPNRLEGEKWLQHKSQRGTGKKPRVGWVGAQQHLGDLTLIREVVEALHKEVEWVFMGMCPDFIKPYVAEEHGWVAFQDYPAKMASLNLDLAIAPLEQHLFNEGKSNLRLLEYGVFGWPVVCTDIYPYQTNNAPVKRVPNRTEAWIEAIRERINDPDAAYREGDALREWVLKHYILEDHVQEWLDALTPSSGFFMARRKQ